MKNPLMRFFLGLTLLVMVMTASCAASVLVTEVMYHPRSYEDYFEYLELFNTGDVPVSLYSWAVGGISFIMPNVTINARSYLIVAKDKAKLLRAYSYLTDEQVVGNFEGMLKNSGEEIQLTDPFGKQHFYMKYSDVAPWSSLADGFGSSLELSCYDAVDFADPHVWRASPPPVHIDSHVEYGGTPGRPSTYLGCPTRSSESPMAQLLITEIMYNVVGKKTYEELHEFVEILNHGNTSIDVSSFRLISSKSLGVAFKFPENTTLEPSEVVVVAKDVNEFFITYNTSVRVFGPYTGSLSNGGDRVVLIDLNNRVVDFINYDDEAPWPIAADGLGIDDDDLPTASPFRENLAYYKAYRGRTLTRRSLSWPTDKAWNWIDADPTPGEFVATPEPLLLPIISHHEVIPELAKIHPGDNVTISFDLRPGPPIGSNVTLAVLQYFVDDVISDFPSEPTIENIEFTYNAASDTFTAVVPAQAASTVIRYKITVSFGLELVTSPRPTDPFAWHAYFVAPEPESESDVIHMFLRPALWTQLWNNINYPISERRVTGPHLCDVRHSWNDRIPCVVVLDGKVVDTQCRYQGSRWNRIRGELIPLEEWPYQGPSNNFLQAMSYNFHLPSYVNYRGHHEIILNKLYHGCTAYETPLLMGLFRDVGAINMNTDFARLNINGGFLRYMMVFYRSFLEESMNKVNEKCWFQETEREGHMFKAQGDAGSEGPFGRGDFRRLPPRCGGSCTVSPDQCPNGEWTELERYEWTFGRKSHKSWGDHLELQNFVLEMDALDHENRTAVRAFFEQKLDIDMYLNYVVIFHWGGTWDQNVHNMYIVQRISDGKWMWVPWDADAMYGRKRAFDTSLYEGEESEYNTLRMLFVRHFKEEVDERFRLFQATLHDTASLKKRFDQVVANFNLSEVAASVGIYAQNWTDCAHQIYDYFDARWGYVESQITPTLISDPWKELERLSCPTRPEAKRVYNTWSSRPGPTPLYIKSNASLGEGRVLLSWPSPFSPNAKLTAYRIELSSDGRIWTESATLSVEDGVLAAEYEYSGMVEDSTVYFRLVVLNELGPSEPGPPIAVYRTRGEYSISPSDDIMSPNSSPFENVDPTPHEQHDAPTPSSVGNIFTPRSPPFGEDADEPDTVKNDAAWVSVSMVLTAAYSVAVL